MINTILGSKRKMGQTFIEDTRVPTTLVKAGPCIVTQMKKGDKEDYWTIQLGFGKKRNKNITKPLQGHLRGVIKDLPARAGEPAQADNKVPRFLREVKFGKEPELKVGNTILASDIFKVGDLIAVTGISKGKGFAGVVKRWKFSGGPKTHGQSDRLRGPGSIGQGTTPGRVYKGKKMAGRMGHAKVTIKNLVVISVEPEKNEILLSGPVPGHIGSLLILKKLASGKLEGLVEKTPQPQICEGEAQIAETTDEKGEAENTQKATEETDESASSQ